MCEHRRTRVVKHDELFTRKCLECGWSRKATLGEWRAQKLAKRRVFSRAIRAAVQRRAM